MAARWRKLAAAAAAVLPGALKLLIYRRVLGARLGEATRIGFGTILFADEIEIGSHTQIGRFNRIFAKRLVLGDYVSIADRCAISAHVLEIRSRGIVSGPTDIKGSITDARSVFYMGMHSWVFEYCYIDVTREVRLEQNVGVGGGSYIFTHGLWLSALHGYPTAFGPVHIARDTWLPWGCFIMPNVTIGAGVVVGARSVVNKSVPDGVLIGGIPAKVLREKSNRDVTFAERLDMLTQVTRDFAAGRGQTFSAVTRDGGVTEFRVGDRRLIDVHEHQSGAPAFAQGVLHLINATGDPGLAARVPVLFLEDYQSSSYSAFDADMRAWLSSARVIGLRFYPIDER